ncbi:MAG: D-alanyl-D-alanine carboxypeptidase [Micropepsaceae bacterium]
MTRARAGFVRSAVAFILGAVLVAASPIVHAGTGNDAALVMDAETGRVLYARSGDAARAPASLTKIMTLYLVFDQIKAGRMSLSDEMTASANAASQKPTKLGLKKGDTLTVEQAIYALVIQSANDVAVVIAEHIGGSEQQFARMMTQRARDLGMKRTTFRNPSGLPDAGQITTARDMAILARASMRNHPDLYRYFSATEFTWKGKTTKTHNRVLTSLKGANGIKTGYTRASGFNLTTSAERNGKRLIGVVLGGDTWKARDDEMKAMLEAWFTQLERRPNLVASYGSGTTIAAAPAPQPMTVAAVEAKEILVPTAPAPVPAAKPVEERRVVAMAPIPDEPEAAPAPAPKKAKPVYVAYYVPQPQAKPAKFGGATRTAKAGAKVEVAEGDTGDDRTLPLSTLTDGRSKDDIATLIAANYSGDDEPAPRKAKAGDWGIQIGAFDSRKAAEHEISRARTASKRTVGNAEDMVMNVTNAEGRTFYRARFTGFTNADAQAACKALKGEGFKCVTFSTATASAE